MDEQEYKTIMGLNTEDVGSVKKMREFVNRLLVKEGYKKLKGWKSMRELMAIKAKLLGIKICK